MLAKNLKNITNIRKCSLFEIYKHKIHSNSTENNEKYVNFGYQKVKEGDKQKLVNEVFEKVASNYDLMNDAASLGLHRLWKDLFIERLGPTSGTRLLDLAGGTGDIAFRFLDKIKNTEHELDSHVTVVDINAKMLEVGQRRCQERLYNPLLIDWVEGNAEKLNFKDESFNACTIAFGLRNVTNIEAALEEIYRVLEPGGRFVCLEFSHVENALFKSVYDAYSFQVIPVLGQILAGNWNSYQYLVESIRKFPNQEALKEMIEFAGFRSVGYENIAFGAVALHSGFKI